MKLSLTTYVRRRLSLRSARSLLTGSAIALGVAGIFALTTIAASGIQARTKDMREEFGPVDISVTVGVNGDMQVLAGRISALPGVAETLDQAVQKLDKLSIKGWRQVGTELRGVDIHSNILEQIHPLSRGRWPHSAQEIAISADLARISGKKIGDRYRLNLGEKSKNLKVVGLVNDGIKLSRGANGVIFAYAALPYIQTMTGRPPNWQEIKVTMKPGADKTTVQRYIQGFNGVEKVSTLDEMIREMGSGAVLMEGIFGLLGGIALFVGSFLIYTTFSITTAEREREYAVLRALGATKRHVRRLVYIEALIMAVIFSGIGLFLGGGLAFLLLWVARLTKVTEGIGFSDLGISAAAVLPSLAAGIIVTLISARGPARRAARVMPAVGLRAAATKPQPSRRRLIGIIMALLGLVIVVYSSAGATSDPEGSLTGGVIGVLAVFIGVVLAMPLLISPVLKAASAALTKWLGILGRLTALNLLRARTRSANTTVMILVGTSLVVAIGALSAGSIAGSKHVVDHQVRFDLAISPQEEPIGLPAKTLIGIRQIPGVKQVTGFTLATPGRAGRLYKPMLDKNGEPITIAGIEPKAFRQTTGIFFKDERTGQWVNEPPSGAWRSLSSDSVFVDSDWAKGENLKTGDYLTLISAGGRSVRFKVTAAAMSVLMGAEQVSPGKVYISQANLAKYFPGRRVLDRLTIADPSLQFDPMIKFAPNADPTIIKRQVKLLLRQHPGFKVVSAQDVRNKIYTGAQGPLAFLYLIFAIALIIGLLGVVNTIAIGVLERRREIGFIRAVGANRRQIKQLIVGETLLLTLLGTFLGTILGAGVAAVFTKMLAPGQISFPFVFPWNTALIVFAATVVFAFAAAIYPAGLAGRISVTAALRYE